MPSTLGGPLAGRIVTTSRRIGPRKSTTASRQAILQKRDALHACNLESLAATHILAHHHVVSAHHIRLRLGEFRAIAIVRPGRQTLLLHAHQPLNLVLGRLMAMGTT